MKLPSLFEIPQKENVNIREFFDPLSLTHYLQFKVCLGVSKKLINYGKFKLVFIEYERAIDILLVDSNVYPFLIHELEIKKKRKILR